MKTSEKALEFFLTNDFGDRYLYSVNRNAFNRIGSDSLYRSLYSDQLFREYQLNIIIGTDSGIFPTYIVKNGIPTGTRYLFVELPDVISTLSAAGMLDALPPEIRIISLDCLADNGAEFNLNDYVFLDAVCVYESVATRDANLPEYRDLSWSLTQEIRISIRKIWTSTNASQFILRQLENLTENRVCFSEALKDAFTGRTAVILAGGPSLKAALPWVKANRDRLVVVAVSRISRILLDEGVIPHVIASVDPQKISFEVSREMLGFTDDAANPLFVCSNHASSLLVGQWQGKMIYTGPRFPWRTPLNIDTLSYSGPTVSNYALDLVTHMGCTTVVLAGVDLCFSADGQTHAAGSNENKVGPDLGQISPRIETYGNGRADTNQGYAESLYVLGLQAKLAAEKGRLLFNSSLNAAKVPFIDFKPLAEIELPDWDEPTTEVIARLVPDSTSATRRTHYRRIKKELERARNKFQDILNLSHEALQCADGLFGRNGRKRDFRHKIKMDKIERRLDRSFGDFSGLVHQFGHKRFCTSLKTTMDEMTDEQVETATYEYYEAYVDGTEYLIDIMGLTLDRIEVRMEEEKESPDFGRLLTQWERDEQFGRLHVWRHRNPNQVQQMMSEKRDAVELLESQFTRVMTEERTSQIELLEKLHDVKHTRSKALLLYKRKEIGELEAMVGGLAGHPDQEKALPYLHFINGLLAELRDEPAEAIAQYQHLLTDPPHSLTEDALLQIAHLSIAVNDADNALLAVECLVGVSPTYLPPYGELLKALGQYEEAFNAYNRYLSFAPDDVGALVTLGMLCKEADLVDAAQELFQRALEKDPLNRAALSMLEGLGAAAQG
jgi:tetratricopeptide (TPR) repeat protein